MVSHVQDIDRGYADLMESLRSFTGVEVLVGVRSTGTELAQDESGAVSGVTLDLAEIAAVHEFGSRDGRIPERSFLRSTVDENRTKIAGLLTEAARKVLFLRAKPKNAYGKVGKAVVFAVQRKISQRIDPPNAASTIARKGSNVPLVDTGRLHESIDYEVVP